MRYDIWGIGGVWEEELVGLFRFEGCRIIVINKLFDSFVIIELVL